MKFLTAQIFFLIIASSFVPLAFATHYDDLGIDDVFYWREWDDEPIDSVGLWWPTNNTDSSKLMIEIEHSGSAGTLYDMGDGQGNKLRYGKGIYFLKAFNVVDIKNGASTNTFTLVFDHECSGSTSGSTFCYSGNNFFIMDGNWVQYLGNSTNGAVWEANPSPETGSNLIAENFPSGTYGSMTSATANSLAACDNESSAGLNDNLACSLTGTNWDRSLTGVVTVIGMFDKDTASQYSINHRVYPKYFTISNTPNGELRWDWPDTQGEFTNYYQHGGLGVIQLNGTEHDYGYYFSWNEDVPDPPTNLTAVLTGDDMFLDWDAPVFNGYDPITGYKIERESPIGGGFSVIVPNTFSTNTFYFDETITSGQEYNYRVRAINSWGESLPSNESKDGIPSSSGSDPTPDVDCTGLDLDTFTLYDRGVTQNSAILCWNGEIITPVANLLGYQINFTTPWGDPLTITTGLNNTGDNATTRLIENLSPATQYSFRVQSWMNGSANNVTQILNITTLPGTLDLDDFAFRGETNPFRWDWGFQTVNLGNNYTSLLVSYADTINATCIFDFKFARNNQTFYNLSTVPLGSDRLLANFTMQNPDNDLIYVTCSDVDDPANEGKTIIYQTSYPLLEQILGFRSGDYGTTGDFGIFDLITLIVVIFSMIGFNRVNSSVGAFFSLAVLGIAWTFGFINPLSATIMGFFITGIALGIFVHHRNENNG